MLFGGMGRLSESSVLNIKNKSFSVTAEIEVPDGGADGPIVAQGGRFGGWGLYAKDGRAAFVYNVLGLQLFVTEAEKSIPAGMRQVRMEFDYDGGGLAKGGDVTLYYDGEKAGEGRVEATHPLIFSADETTDVAYEAGTPVSAEHTRPRFTGKVNWSSSTWAPTCTITWWIQSMPWASPCHSSSSSLARPPSGSAPRPPGRSWQPRRQRRRAARADPCLAES